MRFYCYRCSHCCFFVSFDETPILLTDEVEKLKELAKRFKIKEELKFEKLGGVFYRWLIKGFCPFYDINERKCIIHKEKPITCKMFPLLINIKNLEISVSLSCDWVRANFDKIKNLGEDISKVFPYEYQALIQLVLKLKDLKLI